VKKPQILAALISIVVVNLFATCNNRKNNNTVTDCTYDISQQRKDSLHIKATAAYSYCKKNSMDTTFCLLADMKIHSGNFRFFVWDFQKNKIIDSGMVSHGCGKYAWAKTISKDNPTFSNVDGSHLTSLGKYKIGNRNYSEWGIHVNYLMHGLDATNNNAMKRTIVLHSWDDVPEQEVFPDGTPEGWGCPAVNNQFMIRLDKKLKSAKQPILLWQFFD
jgi:hypothetical protein